MSIFSVWLDKLVARNKPTAQKIFDDRKPEILLAIDKGVADTLAQMTEQGPMRATDYVTEYVMRVADQYKMSETVKIFLRGALQLYGASLLDSMARVTAENVQKNADKLKKAVQGARL